MSKNPVFLQSSQIRSKNLSSLQNAAKPLKGASIMPQIKGSLTLINGIVQTEAPKKTPTAAQALDKEKRKAIDQPFVT